MSLGRIVSVAAIVLVGSAAGLLSIGLLTSRVFNAALGRGDFADESLQVWLVWGARATVGPAAVMALVFALLGLAIVCRKLAVTLSQRARTFDDSVRLAGRKLSRALHLDNLTVVSSFVLLASTVATLLTWWAFWPEFYALLTDVTTAPAEALRPFAPAPAGALNVYQDAYRTPFIWIVDLSILAWYAILRAGGKRHETVHWSMLAGAAGTIVLALGLADVPFRLTNVFNRYDAVRWQDADCYVIGTRSDELLLFCPALMPSRNRVVKVADPSLKPAGVQESIFTPFADGKRPGTASTR